FQLEMYAVAHFVAAGIGMLVLGREIGLPVLPASLGAIVFMFSGFFWAHASHLTILQAAAWMPWLLAVQSRALRRRSVGWTLAGGGLFAVMLLGGPPQIALYLGLALGLFAAFAMAQPGSSWRHRLVALAATAAIMLLGLGLAAPQLAPTIALAPGTDRWDPSPDFLMTDTLTVDQLVTFLIPLAYFGTER